MRTQKYYRHKKKQTRKKRRHKKTRQRGGVVPYSSEATRHRLTRPINALESKYLHEFVDSFTSLIGDTLYKPEKGFIPEIIAYPLDEISDEELTRMGFEDVADVEDVVGEVVADVADVADVDVGVANLEDVDSGRRRNSMDQTKEAGANILKGGPYEERTRSATARAAKAAEIAPGARGTSHDKYPASDVFTDVSTPEKPQND